METVVIRGGSSQASRPMKSSMARGVKCRRQIPPSIDMRCMRCGGLCPEKMPMERWQSGEALPEDAAMCRTISRRPLICTMFTTIMGLPRLSGGSWSAK